MSNETATQGATTRTRATGWRVFTAAAVLASAVLHVYLYTEWAKNLTPLGQAFLAQAAVGVVLAVLVLAWRSPLPLVAALLYGLGSIAAFSLSATTGFLGVTAQLVGWEDFATKGVELLAVVGAVVALVAERRRARS